MKLLSAAVLGMGLLFPELGAAAIPEGLPVWPEDLGRVSREERDRWLPKLEEGPEARLRRALLRLVPEPGRDPRGAREDLAVALAEEDPAWSPVARYALAWLDEEEGKIDWSRDAYQRLCIDHPGTEAAAHAAVRLALAQLYEGRPGRAAAWLETVGGASDLEEMAVRRVLRDSRSGGRWDAAGVRELPSPIRGDALVARGPGRTLVVADRKSGAVLRLDAEGGILDRWDVPEPSAVAVDPLGRVFVASGSSVLKLEGAHTTAFAGQGSFAPAVSIAVDTRGRVFLVDRRESRIGVVDPGGDEPRIVRERKGSRIGSIAWDGRRLVALELRSGAVLAIEPDGAERILAGSVVEDPIALAARPGGEVLCLGRSEVVLVDATGREQDRFETRTLPGFKPSAMAPGWDGSVDLYDRGTGRIVRLP